MNPAELIQACRQGSTVAQGYLFKRLSAKLKMVCLRYVKNNEDAQEILIDGFCKFFMNLHKFSFKGDEAMFVYIKRIMINECLMHLRKRSLFIIVSEELASDETVSVQVLEKIQATELHKLIQQLPAGYRTILNLSAIEGYEHKQIAAALNITESTSRSQLTRARAMLQKMILSNERNYEKQESEY